MRLVLSLFLIQLLMGCAQSPVNNGYRSRSYFGWITAVEKIDADGAIKLESVKTMGIKVGQGFGIGYFEDSSVILPLDCGMVIFVKTIDQIEDLFKTYPHLRQGDNPCIKPGAP